MEPCQVGERERGLKGFWKNVLNKSNLIFKKPDSQVSIDRNRQRLTNILNAISINQKTDWINRNSRKKQHFRKNNLVFEKTPQSIEYNE